MQYWVDGLFGVGSSSRVTRDAEKTYRLYRNVMSATATELSGEQAVVFARMIRNHEDSAPWGGMGWLSF
jgi:hypothetical protein